VTELVRVEPPALLDHSGATSDEHLIGMWLESKKSPHTRLAYTTDIDSFLAFLSRRGITLRNVSAADALDWKRTLSGADRSIARRIATLKSLFSFAHRTGYLPFNVAAILESPNIPNDLTDRMLTEAEVHKMLDVAGPPGVHRRLVLFIYATGARVSEACDACWRHVYYEPPHQPAVTLHGKGGKARVVALAENVARELLSGRLRESDGYIFGTRTGEPMHRSHANKIITQIAKKAGILKPVSPHWLRHAHASHALQRGASAALVQAGLGHSSLATTGQYTHARPTDGAGLYLGL
jgi:site-specific recombinase XerD